MRVFFLIVTFVACAASASAGSREAPEVVDPAGDCAFAAGNEYADVVAAWISDETARDFRVNIQLSKWTQAALATFAGYTLQFTHQGVQWGVAGSYDGQSWTWSTAFIDTEGGAMSNFTATEGAWDQGTLTMSILFPKDLFPHEGNDNKLVSFVGGTADFKKDVPVFIAQGAGAPVAPAGDIMGCDAIESTATYEFTLGQHTMPPATPTSGTAPASPTSSADPAAPAAGETSSPPAPSRDAPLPPLALTVGVLACLAALRRRASRRP